MKIHGNNALILMKVVEQSNVLDYSPEYERRTNEGTIVQLGTDVDTEEFKIGDSAYYSSADITDIHGTSLGLIDAGDIMASSEGKV